MELISDNQLKEEYIAFGRFYTLKYKNKKQVECRSLLHIYERKSYYYLVNTNKVDAVVIMMNPGSGVPIKTFKQRIIDEAEIKNGQVGKIILLETAPDDTQYQVMRVMRKKKWKYVRVINLSDYKEKDSEEFYPMLKESLEYDSEYLHSIFSEKRIAELDNVFISEVEPKVIVAWGVKTKLEKVIKLALSSEKLKNRVGWNKSTYKTEKKKKFYYYHPLQRYKSRSIWVDEIINRL